MSGNKYTWFEDVIVSDDSNKETRGYVILIHNQGTNVVRVDEDILLPDDQLEYSPPAKDKDGFVEKILRIKFLAPLPITISLAAFPQLWSGKRLLIKELKKIGEDG